ncbi:MAG: hypothetical protein MZU79_02655 [Anaerotruncus sp.]|nr:hypothetical protein [Anaerotruncus sp.]
MRGKIRLENSVVDFLTGQRKRLVGALRLDFERRRFAFCGQSSSIRFRVAAIKSISTAHLMNALNTSKDRRLWSSRSTASSYVALFKTQICPVVAPFERGVESGEFFRQLRFDVVGEIAFDSCL